MIVEQRVYVYGSYGIGSFHSLAFVSQTQLSERHPSAPLRKPWRPFESRQGPFPPERDETGRCRAASGHVAAPPSTVMNERRFSRCCMRSPPAWAGEQDTGFAGWNLGRWVQR
jgi:hypothetical protein